MFLESVAWAQTAAPLSQGGGFLQMMLPLAIMFLIFYFLLIRPQQKKAKEHSEFLRKLQRGDEVVTASGIHGKIHGLADQVVTLEVDQNCHLKVDRLQISRLHKGA